MPNTLPAQTSSPKQAKKYESASFREFISMSKWVFKLVYKFNPGFAKTFVISESLSSLYVIAEIYIISKILDLVIKIAGSSEARIEDIFPYMIILLGFNVLHAILLYFSRVSKSSIYEIVYFHLRRELYLKLKDLGIQSLEQPDISNKISRANQEIHRIGNYFVSSVNTIATLTSLLAALIIVVFAVPVVAPIIIIFTVPTFLNDKRFRRLLWKFKYENTEEQRKANMNPWYLTNPIGLLEIFINGTHDFMDRKYTDFVGWFTGVRIKIRKGWFKRMQVFATLMDIGNYIGYIMVFSQFLGGVISVGTVLFRIRVIDRLSRDLDRWLDRMTALYEDTVAIKDIYLLFRMTPAFEDGTVKFPKISEGPEIKIENLSFTYPRADTEVLKDINLNIKSGEKVAIVGHNGAGKTTLVKLLARIYLPDSGKILVNDYDLSKLVMNSWYANIGVLFQEYNTYNHMTVRENVIIGRPKEQVHEQMFVESLERADALDFVNDFKDKFDQILSERYKGGTRLSTGQWQKLAIARFFYRNAPLVIFDEPTAAIDAVSEYNIFNKIYSFFEGKTAIIISHRFSTVRNADRIVVLEKGRIIEEGTHDGLMKKNGYYAKAFRLQAEGYADSTDTIAE